MLHQIYRLLPLFILSSGMLFWRMYFTESNLFFFLFWNLFLAFVPWIISWGLKAYKNPKMILFFFIFAVWLLFFPNAPYMLTDFFHLKTRNLVPLWYDLLLFGNFALLSLMLGYYSLDNMADIFKKKWGAKISWLMIVSVSFLSGFGIYLGRYLRLNTWEIVTDHFYLVNEIITLINDPRDTVDLWSFTFFYGAFILVGYIALRKRNIDV